MDSVCLVFIKLESASRVIFLGEHPPKRMHASTCVCVCMYPCVCVCVCWGGGGGYCNRTKANRTQSMRNLDLVPVRDSSSSERPPCEVHLPAPLWRLSSSFYPWRSDDTHRRRRSITYFYMLQCHCYGRHYMEFKPRGGLNVLKLLIQFDCRCHVCCQ